MNKETGAYTRVAMQRKLRNTMQQSCGRVFSIRALLAAGATVNDSLKHYWLRGSLRPLFDPVLEHDATCWKAMSIFTGSRMLHARQYCLKPVYITGSKGANSRASADQDSVIRI